MNLRIWYSWCGQRQFEKFGYSSATCLHSTKLTLSDQSSVSTKEYNQTDYILHSFPLDKISASALHGIQTQLVAKSPCV